MHQIRQRWSQVSFILQIDCADGHEDIKRRDVLKNVPVVNSQTMDIRDIGELLQLFQEINHRLLIRRCQITETTDNFACFTSMICRKSTGIRWANDIFRR